jgi:hypothetical protein
MRSNLLIRPRATLRSQPRWVWSRRTIAGISCSGWLYGCGIIVGCIGLAGTIAAFVRAEHHSDYLARASPWVLFIILGATMTWRCKPKRVMDRFQSCREMLNHMRMGHGDQIPNQVTRDE